MPRLISTLSRIFKLIFYSWLTLIGLWAFLPSIRISSDYSSQYIRDILNSGQLLHTVYPWDKSFEAASVTIVPPNALYPGSERQWARVRGMPSSDCTHVLADWQFVTENAAFVLGVGRDLRTRLNLTDAALKVRNGMLRNEAAKLDDLVILFSEDDGKDETVYISDTVTVQVDAGGRDHITNLPWFHTPDAAWFHNQMHGFDYYMDIRVVARHLSVDDTIIVEIWKSAPVTEWLRLRYETEQVENDPSFGPVTPPKDDNKNVKFVKNIFRSEEHYSSGLLASFVDVAKRPHVSHSSVWDVRVMFRNAELTSRTYWIRSMLLVVLAPTLMVAFVLLENAVGFLSVLICTEILSLVAFYCVAVLVSWIIYNIRHRNSSHLNADGKEGESRKMRFLEWSSKFWLTRWLYFLIAYCCCCCCCGHRAKRRGYRSDEKRRKRVVIWGPSGPVYEDGV